MAEDSAGGTAWWRGRRYVTGVKGGRVRVLDSVASSEGDVMVSARFNHSLRPWTKSSRGQRSRPDAVGRGVARRRSAARATGDWLAVSGVGDEGVIGGEFSGGGACSVATRHHR